MGIVCNHMNSCFPAALMTSDEAQPVTPGKMSHRQGKEGHPIQTKELLQPSALSPGVSYSIGKEHQRPV